MESHGAVSMTMHCIESEQSQWLGYQVCRNEPGETPFNGVGGVHESLNVAIKELKRIRARHPDAYLASLTYQRCHENGQLAFPHAVAGPPAQGTAQRLERIAATAHDGLRATETLQAVASLLGHLKPTEEEEPAQLAEDLVIAVSGMVEQLQTIHDAFDIIGIRAGQNDDSTPVREVSSVTRTEPAMV